MSVYPQWRLPPAGLDRASDGEHPAVVLRDVASRPRPKAHIIVFANEKGGAGKSTLAFHSSIALSNRGSSVAVFDLDHSQESLAHALINREATCRRLQVSLPSPVHVTLNCPSGAQLHQEIARIARSCQFVVIDLAGQDSPSARRAIAMADTLVTPVNSSFADLSLLGQFDALTMRLRNLGPFARRVAALRDIRCEVGLPRTDWVVMPNRLRRSGSRNESRFNTALDLLAQQVGFRLGRGLADRVAYRELYPYGLTLLDLKKIPQLASVNLPARREVEQMVADMQLPVFANGLPPESSRAAAAPVFRAPVARSTELMI